MMQARRVACLRCHDQRADNDDAGMITRAGWVCGACCAALARAKAGNDGQPAAGKDGQPASRG
jgi:hypothetical protein